MLRSIAARSSYARATRAALHRRSGEATCARQSRPLSAASVSRTPAAKPETDAGMGCHANIPLMCSDNTSGSRCNFGCMLARTRAGTDSLGRRSSASRSASRSSVPRRTTSEISSAYAMASLWWAKPANVEYNATLTPLSEAAASRRLSAASDTAMGSNTAHRVRATVIR